jgi:hypothetical protein
MNALQLTHAIACSSVLKHFVRDVVSADYREPDASTLILPCAYIVNTDIASDPGRHWLAITIGDNAELELFDSYGLSPPHYSHVRLLKDLSSRFGTELTYNRKRLQHAESNVCGQYCLYYLLMKQKYNLSVSAIVDRFIIILQIILRNVPVKYRNNVTIRKLV